MIIRGSTPTHVFKFKFNPESTSESPGFDEIVITYMQEGKIILTKEKKDLTFSTVIGRHGEPSYFGYYTLTQQETELFKSTEYYQSGQSFAEVQLRALTPDGTVIATPIHKVEIKRTLNERILGEEDEEI